jgi:predicted XRE-type DNA-binding protein
METYEVDAGYDGKWWVFDIPALFTAVNGRQIVARGQARTAAEVAGEARDIIAMWTDVDEATTHVSVRFSMPEEIREAIARARERENAARSIEQEAAQARRFAARALVNDQGMTQSDAATMLGVSRQRVHQLVS